MKTIKVGPLTLVTPQTASDHRRLLTKWRQGRLDVGMAERMHPDKKRTKP